MDEPLRVSRGEATSSEILEHLDARRRVIIEVEVLGRTMEMTTRRQGGTYYCDTPVKLLTYETEEEMRACLERYRLAESDTDASDTNGEG